MIDQYVNSIEDKIAKKFILRALIGTINGAIVGAAATIVRRTQPEEASGVDGYNEARNDEVAPEAPYGLEAPEDPQQTLSALLGVKERLLERCLGDLPPEEVPSSIAATIEWMAGREYKPVKAQLEAVAALLELTVEEVEAAQRAQRESDARWLREHKQELLDVINDTPASGGFEELPARLQYRLLSRLQSAIERQIQMAIQAVLRGKLDAAGSVALYKETIEDINKMVRLRSNEDPQFKEAAEMAA